MIARKLDITPCVDMQNNHAEEQAAKYAQELKSLASRGSTSDQLAPLKRTQSLIDMWDTLRQICCPELGTSDARD